MNKPHHSLFFFYYIAASFVIFFKERHEIEMYMYVRVGYWPAGMSTTSDAHSQLYTLNIYTEKEKKTPSAPKTELLLLMAHMHRRSSSSGPVLYKTTSRGGNDSLNGIYIGFFGAIYINAKNDGRLPNNKSEPTSRSRYSSAGFFDFAFVVVVKHKNKKMSDTFLISYHIYLIARLLYIYLLFFFRITFYSGDDRRPHRKIPFSRERAWESDGQLPTILTIRITSSFFGSLFFFYSFGVETFFYLFFPSM